MSLFKKKEEKAPPQPGQPGQAQPPGELAPPAGMPSNTPKDAVLNLRQQGLTNNQIIQELQRQGYNSQQIFDALNINEPTNAPAGPIPGQPEPTSAPQGMPPQMPEGMAPEGMPAEEPSMDFDVNKEKIEEMAEAIIDEKWEELVKSINKIIEWKEKMETTIHKIEQEIKDIKDNFNQVHDSIIGKIHEYDKNILNVGTELKAMEKVFEKVLPTFTENVSELNRIIKGKRSTTVPKK